MEWIFGLPIVWQALAVTLLIGSVVGLAYLPPWLVIEKGWKAEIVYPVSGLLIGWWLWWVILSTFGGLGQ